MALNVKENGLIHQSGFANRSDARRVCVITDVIHGLQFDKWHATSRDVVDNLDREVIVWLRPIYQRRQVATAKHRCYEQTRQASAPLVQEIVRI